MKKIVVILFFLLVLLQLSVGQAQENKVLIASSGGAFKEAVVLKLNTALEELGYKSTSISLKELKTIALADYEAVVLLNSCWAWHLNRHVRAFLKRTKGKAQEKIVLITTAGDPDWKAKVKHVDAITAASKMDDVAALVNKVVGKISAITS